MMNMLKIPELKGISAIVLTLLAIMAIVYLIYFVIILLRGPKNVQTVEGGGAAMKKAYNLKTYNSNVRNDFLPPMENIPANPDMQSSLYNQNPIQIGFSSLIGKRKYQQDSIITIEDGLLRKLDYRKCIAILCDGMGGMEGGELASAMSAKTLYDDYISMMPKKIPDFFHDEVRKLDKMVCGLTNEKNEPIDSGSTLISVVIEDGKLYWASVGDSRIYIIRNNEMVQITTDHNYYYILKQQAERGIITFEEAASNPQAEALISFIGIGKESETDINEQPFELKNGDILLLCSDGLYKTLSDVEIKSIITNNQNDMIFAANALTKAAIDKNRKGQDNTSVVLVRYTGK